MKIYFRVLLIVSSLLVISCSYLITPIQTKNYSDDSYLIDNDYRQSLHKIVDEIQRNPENEKLYEKAGICLYKLDKYKESAQFLEIYFSKKPQKFSYDAYFYIIDAYLQLSNLEKAKKYFQVLKSHKVSENIKVNNLFLDAKIDYYSKNYSLLYQKINNIFRHYDLPNKLKTNLAYVQIEATVKQKKYGLSMEVIANTLSSGTFKDNYYLKQISLLLDKIIFNSDDNFLKSYKMVLDDIYNNILLISDNMALKRKIQDDIENIRKYETEVQSNIQDKSYIGTIKLTNTPHDTRVIFKSKDSIDYSYKYNGKSLQLILKNKSIKSPLKELLPPMSSGIKSFTWHQNNNDLVVSINFMDEYGMYFEHINNSFESIESEHVSLILTLEGTQNKTKYSTNTKNNRYTVVIDPGHGGDDPGALGILKNSRGEIYTEKYMALLLSKKLKSYLETKGYQVFLTRNRDYYPPLYERNRIAQNRNADIFLSIHLNSSSKKYRKLWQSDRYVGSELVVRRTIGSKPKFINLKASGQNSWLKKRKIAMKEHIKLSSILSNTIPRNFKKPFNKRRTTKYKNLAIFSGMTIPHALIEAGFMVHNKTVKYLLTKEGQNDFCRGVYEGIEEYRKK